MFNIKSMTHLKSVHLVLILTKQNCLNYLSECCTKAQSLYT